jgi:hypothetical protein
LPPRLIEIGNGFHNSRGQNLGSWNAALIGSSNHPRIIKMSKEIQKMTRIKSLFAVLAIAAIVAVVPASAAVNVHFVGAGSSAQFLTAAVGADALALQAPYNAVAPGACAAGLSAVYHWTGSTAAMIDRRNANIHNEPGKIWIVWITPCGNAPETGVTDLWTDMQVDSTVGVRAFMAQESAANGGAGAQMNVTPGASAALVTPVGLWPDGTADFAPTTAGGDEITAINAANGGGGINITVGLTDIRPEDALFATTRAISGPVDTLKWSKLGYTSAVKCVGAAILTAQSTGTDATPICFNLTGSDPLLKPAHAVRSYTTIPVGAAPIIFVTNNNGSANPIVTNLVTNIIPGVNEKLHEVNGATHFPLSNLFNGQTSCDYSNPAFVPPGPATAITVFLREPLSGTMNTTEFSLFRTEDNPSNSQEVGIVAPLGGPPQNPLSWTCGPSNSLLGKRSRAIGTGEVVGKSSAVPPFGIQGTPNSLGYFFFGFANASKLAGVGFNYLTLDGVDPVFNVTPAGQQLINCAGPCTAAGLGTDQYGWGLGTSYPHLRDGTYPAWSLYRWVADPNDPHFADVTALAQAAQDNVNTTDADFVPFHTSSGNDGLDVYRAHFLPTGVTLAKLPPGTVVSAGAQTAASIQGYTSLGGGNEGGGDVGGCIAGPFSTASARVPLQTATVNTNGLTVTSTSGAVFAQGDLWEKSPVVINGVEYHVASVTSGTVLKLTTTAGIQTSVAFQFGVTLPAGAQGAIACRQ